MVIAGILHPQEFWDLASGLLYFLTIPSGYLLLTIFMLTNMHNVSWGRLNCHYYKKNLCRAPRSSALPHAARRFGAVGGPSSSPHEGG